MSQLHQTKSRIKSVDSTRKITKAMELAAKKEPYRQPSPLVQLIFLFNSFRQDHARRGSDLHDTAAPRVNEETAGLVVKLGHTADVLFAVLDKLDPLSEEQEL